MFKLAKQPLNSVVDENPIVAMESRGKGRRTALGSNCDRRRSVTEGAAAADGRCMGLRVGEREVKRNNRSWASLLLGFLFFIR